MLNFKTIFKIIIIFKLISVTNVLADELFSKGKSIFLNQGNCATCHSLKDAGSITNIGPSLNIIKPDIGRVKNAVINGIGVMPSALGILNEDEIDAVSYYVFKSTDN